MGDDVKAEPLPSGFRRQLSSYGLVGPDGELTTLGAGIRYHVIESQWQAACEDRDGLPALMTDRPGIRVLDVGCGAAQTLRLLATAGSAKLVGIDTDLVALALGLRFAQLEGVSIGLAGAAADSLPFRDESFDLVLCRVALNYMHQRGALAEMARVLAVGGHLYLRVERIWHDAYLIAQSRSARALACRCRDLGHGVVHALAGWQVAPGSRIRVGRAFASAGRVEHMLRPLGCRIVRVEETQSCPRILGRRTQLTIVARRESMGSQTDVARG
ncbi:class I SAM-dependent methyltransferase [Paludisphaera rhizosphaerae]|uniref:class I SAM-dependent methyltransferase n=1 Tax=Paludisphaera rhizosphaerae TaxID=2711216 RepID=UPI0013EA9A3D|nr:class I SAM-dependent methyltransferase [Paludisphaera rhizosphaerae]